jgi:hypothetical protein
VTDRRQTDSGADNDADDDVAERLRRAEQTASKSFLELIPRRDLVKVVLLLIFLVVVIALQRRSGAVIDSLTRGLSGPQRVQPREAPPVRMAPPAPRPQP